MKYVSHYFFLDNNGPYSFISYFGCFRCDMRSVTSRPRRRNEPSTIGGHPSRFLESNPILRPQLSSFSTTTNSDCLSTLRMDGRMAIIIVRTIWFRMTLLHPFVFMLYGESLRHIRCDQTLVSKVNQAKLYNTCRNQFVVIPWLKFSCRVL